MIGFPIVFFIPGFLIVKKDNILERISLSVVISILISIALIQYLNFIGFPINNFFLLAYIPIIILLVFLERKNITIKNLLRKKEVKYILIILLLSILLKILFFSRSNWLPLGSDIVRWGTVSHSWFLNAEITKDLMPFFPSGNFFIYTPTTLFMVLITETLFFNPASGAIIISILMSSMSVLSFYLFCREFLNQKKAVYACFYYTILFDSSLIYLANRFMLSFSAGFFPMFLSMFYISKGFNEKKIDKMIIPSLILLVTTHLFHIFPVILFLISVFILKHDKKILKKLIILGIISLLISIIIFLPYFLIFMENIGHTSLPFISAEWYNYEIISENFNKNIFTLLLYNIFVNGMEPFFVFSYLIGFMITLFVFNRFKNKKKVVSLFFIICFISTTFYISNPLFSRFSTFPKIVYPISLSLLFNDVGSATFWTVMAIITPRSPIWYSLFDFNDTYLDVTTIEEIHAYEFIKNNVPPDSIFLIDGGGEGIFEGHSGSHGDRIFILTSRRIFYYSGIMDLEEYQKRVRIYRDVSINPNNQTAIQALKQHNITHIFIGPTDIGLDKDKFLESNNYEKLWQEGNVFVFKII